MKKFNKVSFDITSITFKCKLLFKKRFTVNYKSLYFIFLEKYFLKYFFLDYNFLYNHYKIL